LDSFLRQVLHGGARLGRGLAEVDLTRRDHARPDFTLLDAIAQREVLLGRATAGEDGGVARLDQRFHLRGVVVVDVLVTVDEAGHRAHALGVDDLEPLCGRRTRGDGYDLAASHDDRTGVDHLAPADNDTRVRDRHVLRGCDLGRDRDDRNETRLYKHALHRFTPFGAAAGAASGGIVPRRTPFPEAVRFLFRCCRRGVYLPGIWSVE